MLISQYLNAIWSVINFEEAEKRFTEGAGSKLWAKRCNKNLYTNWTLTTEMNKFVFSSAMTENKPSGSH